MTHTYMLMLYTKLNLDSDLFSEVNLRIRILYFMLLANIQEIKNPFFLPQVLFDKIKEHYMPFIRLYECESYQKMPHISHRWYNQCIRDERDRKYSIIKMDISEKINDMGMYQFASMVKHKDRFLMDFMVLNEREAEFRGGGPPIWGKDLIKFLLGGSFIDFKNITSIIKIFSEILDLKDKMDNYHKEAYTTFFQKYAIFFQILFDRLFYIIDMTVKDYKILQIGGKTTICIKCTVAHDHEMIRAGKKQRNVSVRRFTGYSIERVEGMCIKPEANFYSNTFLEHMGKIYFKIYDSDKLEGYNYKATYVPAEFVEI